MKRHILFIIIVAITVWSPTLSAHSESDNGNRYLPVSLRAFFVDSTTIVDPVIVEYKDVKYVISGSYVHYGLNKIQLKPGIAFVYRDNPYNDMANGLEYKIPKDIAFQTPSYTFAEKRGKYKIYRFSERLSTFCIAVVQTNWLNRLLSGEGKYHQ